MSQYMEIRHHGIIICVIISLPYWEHWDAFAFGGIITYINVAYDSLFNATTSYLD